MCYIEISNLAGESDLETLLTYAQSNPDGGGVVYWDDGWVWRKGMTSRQAVDMYLGLGITAKGLHLRFTTAGESSPHMTHPFTTDAKNLLSGRLEGRTSLIMHNGSVAGLGDKVYSDTYYLAKNWDILDNDDKASVPWRLVEFVDDQFRLWGEWHKPREGLYMSHTPHKYGRRNYYHRDSDYLW